MKKLALISILVWWFAFRVETDREGVYMHFIQGPYEKAVDCAADYLDVYTGMVALFGLESIKFTKCEERVQL